MAEMLGAAMSLQVYVDGEEVLSMSNGNAADVMSRLGVGDMWATAGEGVGVRDMIKRCKAALALPEDREVETVVDKQEGRATIVFCGREAGYIEGRINQLLTACEAANQFGEVWWS